MDLNVEGLDDLRSRLQETKEMKKAENRALKKAAGRLETRAKTAAPVDTGNLKSEITTGAVKDGKIDVGVDQQGDAYYGHMIEFGTSKTPAQPFLRPSFERERSNIENIMSQEIRKGLDL